MSSSAYSLLSLVRRDTQSVGAFESLPTEYSAILAAVAVPAYPFITRRISSEVEGRSPVLSRFFFQKGEVEKQQRDKHIVSVGSPPGKFPPFLSFSVLLAVNF